MIREASPDLITRYILEEGLEETTEATMKAVLTRLFQNCGEEVIENLAQAANGAFSPWQLIQIPVEIAVYGICKLFKKDEKFCYDMGKLASFITAAVAGGAVGGQAGFGGAVLFWVVGEFVAWVIRKLLDYFSSGRYSERFGDSQTEKLLKCLVVRADQLSTFVTNLLKSGSVMACDWMENQNLRGVINSINQWWF